MNPILTAGVLIGILCSAWTFILGFTGLYKSPAANVVFISVAMAIEVVVLTWGLRRTAAEGRAYGGQILAGTMMAIVAGVIIIASSLLFTTVVFPNYFARQAICGCVLLIPVAMRIPWGSLSAPFKSNRAAQTLLLPSYQVAPY